ncbi:hypothetical protein WDU94_000022, partial [Cyamophila willieti]
VSTLTTQKYHEAIKANITVGEFNQINNLSLEDMNKTIKISLEQNNKMKNKAMKATKKIIGKMKFEQTLKESNLTPNELAKYKKSRARCWSPERRQNQSQRIKEHWKQLRDEGRHLDGGKKISTKLKQYWKKQRHTAEHGNGTRLREVTKMFKDSWRIQREKGITLRQSRASEAMKEWWKRAKEDIAMADERNRKAKEKLQRYWTAMRQTKNGTDERCQKLGGRMKEFWLTQKIQNKPDRKRQNSELFKEFWRQEKRNKSGKQYNSYAERMRDFWKQINEETGIERRKELSDKYKEYWQAERKTYNNQTDGQNKGQTLLNGLDRRAEKQVRKTI